MNKKTKQARKAGYCSMDDMLKGGNKIFSGKECNTAWNNPNSRRTAAHVYRRANVKG